MESDLKNAFAKQNTVNGFIKITDAPVSGLSDDQKVQLNRKGNMLFNNGDISGARRIFLTTGYSDGLSRVGDVLLSQKKELDALKLYLLAHNKRKSEPLLKKAASLISMLINDIKE